MSIEDLIKRLQAIAHKNKDRFRYHIDVEPKVTKVGDKSWPLRYTFVCVEAEEGHPFVTGQGLSVEAACESADLDIPDALGQWGYKE